MVLDSELFLKKLYDGVEEESGSTVLSKLSYIAEE